MKIAVIGAGISGLVAAHRLTTQGHNVSVFEAGDRYGGHVQSSFWSSAGVRRAIEVGFLVFNEATCPRLRGLLSELETPTRSLGVAYEIRQPASPIVLRGGSLRELLGVPANLAVPAFYRVVPDWLRFMRRGRRQLQRRAEATTLSEFLGEGAYSQVFTEQFVYPLAGAICPVERTLLRDMPLASFFAFIDNHGLSRLRRTSTCRTLVDGSHGYLRRLTDGFRDRIHLNCPVEAVARHEDYVLLKFPRRSRTRFDRVVLAVHADLALRILADPTRQERQTLSAFRYGLQNVFVHRGEAPAGASPDSAVWTFQPSPGGAGGVAMSYPIAHVQGVDVPEDLTLTMQAADQRPPENVLSTFRFRRPVHSPTSLLAQNQFASINGRRRTYFCGSYWGHGFHEDAVRSAEEIVKRLSRDAGRQNAASRQAATA